MSPEITTMNPSSSTIVEKVKINRKLFFGCNVPTLAKDEDSNEEEILDYALGILYGNNDSNLELTTIQPIWNASKNINNYCINQNNRNTTSESMRYQQQHLQILFFQQQITASMIMHLSTATMTHYPNRS